MRDRERGDEKVEKVGPISFRFGQAIYHLRSYAVNCVPLGRQNTFPTSTFSALSRVTYDVSFVGREGKLESYSILRACLP